MMLSQPYICHLCRSWLLALVSLLGIASQCGSAIPPLPPTPSGPVLQVALLVPTSGELDTKGRMIQNGSMLALDEWNNGGGVQGHRLEVVIYNTNCTFESGHQAAKQAIDDGLQFIVGPVCSEAAVAAAELAEAMGVLMIAPAATHPLVTTNHQGQTRITVFRTVYSYDWQGEAAARFARDALDVDKVALLSQPGDAYTTNLTDTFAREFLAGGGLSVYQENYTPGTTDFTEILTTIEQTGAELIYLPASHSVANRVANQLNELRLSKVASPSDENMLLLGSDAWESAALDLTVTTGSYFPVHFVPDDDRPLLKQWVESYKSTYATEPNTLAALGYDSINMLARATEQADKVDPAVVATVLEKETFKGITGQITFDLQHNPIKPVPILYIQDGRANYFNLVEP